MTDVLALLGDAVLRREYDAETLRRAQDYVRAGRVDHVNVFEQGRAGARVLATVQGSASRAYSVLVTVTADTGRAHRAGPIGDIGVWSRCSCPVGDQCKHGAAVALVAGGQSRDSADRAWEVQLVDVLGDLERPGPTAPPKALAVRVDVRRGRHYAWGHSSDAITLRLVQQGARDRWVKTGVSWASLAYADGRGIHEPKQLAALQPLHAGLLSRRGYHSTVDQPELDEFGPQLWSALTDAQAAGVVLVPGDSVRAVHLGAGVAEVVADVVATPDGARLTAGITYDNELWTGDRVEVVGDPVHGVALLEQSETDRSGTASYDVVLVRLAAPVPASLGRLLSAAEPVELPERSRERWAGVLLPRLARSVQLGSSDGSVAVRALPAPRLRLVVEWDSAHLAHVTWHWRYGDTPAAPTCPIDARTDLDGLRDRAAEAAAQEHLVDSGAWPGRPVASEEVRGAAALHLALLRLPALRESGAAEVLELGRPDFRAAEGPIEISFESARALDSARDPTGDATDDPVDEGPVDWLDLQVTVRVGDHLVPLPDVLTALTLGEEQIVLPSGLFIDTARAELADLAELVRAAAQISEAERDDRIRIGRDDLGAWAQVGDTGTVDDAALEWVQRAQALRDLVELPTPEPIGVLSTLRDYQRQGFHWLAFLWQCGLGGVLADDMGLGKTLQVLALISHARASPAEGAGPAGPFLVVAPTSVVSAWQSEVARHTPHLRISAVTSSLARRGGVSVADLAADADIVVTTYTLLRLESEQYAATAWSGLVLDEAQQVKNHRGKTYDAVRRVRAPFRLAVTGTPFENRLTELWALLSITTPGLYPTVQDFTRHVAKPVEKDRDSEALARFRTRVKPFMLRRTKELVAPDLPPKQEQVLEVTLPPRHRRLYDTHLQRERQKILGLMGDFEKNRIAIFSALTRLRQLALDPGLVDPEQDHVGSAKLELLVEQLTEVVAEGHCALVFSQFTRYLGRVRERLESEGLDLCYLDGRTRDRAGEITRFRSGAASVFLISLKAGGVGLTLTEADYVYVLDPWWNPATEAQAVDRAHRIGQDRPVLVYRMVSVDTIEDKVMALKERKAELFAQVVDGDGLLAETITADDVRALVD